MFRDERFMFVSIGCANKAELRRYITDRKFTTYYRQMALTEWYIRYSAPTHKEAQHG